MEKILHFTVCHPGDAFSASAKLGGTALGYADLFGNTAASRGEQAALAPFYEVPSDLAPGNPGNLIRAEIADLARLHGTAWGVLFPSQDAHDRATVSSGLISVPTVGQADRPASPGHTGLWDSVRNVPCHATRASSTTRRGSTTPSFAISNDVTGVVMRLIRNLAITFILNVVRRASVCQKQRGNTFLRLSGRYGSPATRWAVNGCTWRSSTVSDGHA
jgi:hypothetical protein